MCFKFIIDIYCLIIIYFCLNQFVPRIIQMNPIENRLFDLNLPDFVDKFKNKCVNLILPYVDSSIQIVESVDSPLIVIFIILIVIQLVRLALQKDNTNHQSQSSSFETKQLGKQIKDLKKELVSIKNMLHQVKNIRGLGNSGKDSDEISQKLIESCRSSWQKRESVALQIMDWQVKITNEVTKLKSKSKIRGSNSKSVISSIQKLNIEPKMAQKSAIHSNSASLLKQPLFKNEPEREKRKIESSTQNVYIHKQKHIIKEQSQQSLQVQAQQQRQLILISTEQTIRIVNQVQDVKTKIDITKQLERQEIDSFPLEARSTDEGDIKSIPKVVIPPRPPRVGKQSKRPPPPPQRK